MRPALLLLALLLAGCIAQQTARQAPSATITNGSISGINESVENASVINASSAGGANDVLGNLSNASGLTEVAEGNMTTKANTSSNAPPAPEGIYFPNRDYLLVLDDVSVPAGGSCGIFSIRYSENSSIITRLVICPGDSHYWLSPDGHLYRIFVTQVAAGYAHEEKWARVFIYG